MSNYIPYCFGYDYSSMRVSHCESSSIYIIPPHWHDTCNGNPPSCKAGIYQFYIANIMHADGLPTERARASASTILTMLNQNNSFTPRLTLHVLVSHIWVGKLSHHRFNTLRPRQNGHHFAGDISRCIFLNANVWIPIKISLKFIPKGPVNNIPTLVQIMA